MKNNEENFVVPLTRPAVAGHPLPSGEGFALLRPLVIANELGGALPVSLGCSRVVGSQAEIFPELPGRVIILTLKS